MEKVFYVYAWNNKNSGEVFYVGKGKDKRYKNIHARNELFLEYIKNNEVDVKIILNNLSEEEAFNKEKEVTEYYKALGQCQCNLAKPGAGGLSYIWTSELKEYWSENNPMKEEKQRQRMRDNNPMKNKEVALKSGAKHKRPVIIDGILYAGVIDAANFFGVRDVTITSWCKKGQNPQGKVCKYADEEQKEYVPPKNQKGVIIDGTGYYPSIKAAALALGVKDSSPLCKALKNNQKYKGHICEYANQQPSQENSKK